ncbi:hypothetical protein SS50377_21598 [Spironucleus salmonicida]|uniref:Transmembrane protein n=1 Tax=Spironucleus salmonicida TaxID=348837 RepID=V6LZ75_9EUKA|nr:hypothetical protein SS50377_21598 [Spironucleus salmonicida]|eukprot:EST46139.1 Hypothetical protein SS50377_13856 [Spironucleus salmonicida]
MLYNILALNCFTDTILIYSQQTEELEFIAKQALSISQVDKDSCNIFINQNVIVHIQIGSIMFSSEYYNYDEKQINLTLRRISGDLKTIKQFSVAFFRIETLNDNIYQDSTVIRFNIKFFDRRNCFKNVSLLYDIKNSQVTVQRFSQQLCNFDVQGDIQSSVYVQTDDKYKLVLQEKLAEKYNEWFSTNTTCTDTTCAKFIPELIQILFPLGYYQILIPQTMKKETQAYKPDGTLVKQDTDFKINLILKQTISQFTVDKLITTIDNITLHPLYKSIEVDQKINMIASNIDPVYDSIIVDICIAASNSNSSRYQCFSYKQSQFQPVETIIYRCDQQDDTSFDLCTEKLLQISEFTNDAIGLVYYDTYKDGKLKESFKYYANVVRNNFQPIILTCMLQKVCIAVKLRKGTIMTHSIKEFILEWVSQNEKQRLINVFNFPNENEQYCFAASSSQLSSLTDINSTEFRLSIGDQSLFINKIEDLLQPDVFVHGIIATLILAVIIGCILVILMLFNNKIQK